MLTVTSAELHKDTKNIQNLADKEPVLIENGNSKQVLLDYDHYQKIVGKEADKPFVSAYDAFFANMSPELYQALAKLDDKDLED